MSYLVLDCEIEKAILKKGELRLTDIKYIESTNPWRAFKEMGLSCTGVYDSAQDTFRVFGKHDTQRFQTLIDQSETVVTFNGKAFDGPLLAEHGVIIPDAKHYDLLVAVWNAHGLPGQFQPGSHAGYGLDACAYANHLPMKTGHGALAPIMWQRGQYCEVIDYCLNDVWITHQLFKKIQTGLFVSPVEKVVMPVSFPGAPLADPPRNYIDRL